MQQTDKIHINDQYSHPRWATGRSKTIIFHFYNTVIERVFREKDIYSFLVRCSNSSFNCHSIPSNLAYRTRQWSESWFSLHQSSPQCLESLCDRISSFITTSVLTIGFIFIQSKEKLPTTIVWCFGLFLLSTHFLFFFFFDSLINMTDFSRSNTSHSKMNICFRRNAVYANHNRREEIFDWRCWSNDREENHRRLNNRFSRVQIGWQRDWRRILSKEERWLTGIFFVELLMLYVESLGTICRWR